VSVVALPEIQAERVPRWRADLALAFVALVWGSTFVIVKGVLNDVSTLYFLALRFTLASGCMLLLFLPAFRRLGWKNVARGLIGGSVTGLLLWFGYVLQSFGLKYTSAGNSGFITGFYIVLVPILSAAIYRRLPQPIELLGLSIATAGLVLLTVPGITGGRLTINRGDVLTAGCAVAYAFHLLVLGYYSQREAFEPVALGQIACTALLSWTSLLMEPPSARWHAGTIVGVVVTSVLATALAFALQTWGQKYTTATRTALLFALEPVFAMATAVVAGGENLTVARLAGCVLILGGILTVELKPARTA